MAQIIDVNPEMGDWTGAMNMAMDQKKLDEKKRQFDESSEEQTRQFGVKAEQTARSLDQEDVRADMEKIRLDSDIAQQVIDNEQWNRTHKIAREKADQQAQAWEAGASAAEAAALAEEAQLSAMQELDNDQFDRLLWDKGPVGPEGPQLTEGEGELGGTPELRESVMGLRQVLSDPNLDLAGREAIKKQFFDNQTEATTLKQGAAVADRVGAFVRQGRFFLDRNGNKTPLPESTTRELQELEAGIRNGDISPIEGRTRLNAISKHITDSNNTESAIAAQKAGLETAVEGLIKSGQPRSLVMAAAAAIGSALDAMGELPDGFDAGNELFKKMGETADWGKTFGETENAAVSANSELFTNAVNSAMDSGILEEGSNGFTKSETGEWVVEPVVQAIMQQMSGGAGGGGGGGTGAGYSQGDMADLLPGKTAAAKEATSQMNRGAESELGLPNAQENMDAFGGAGAASGPEGSAQTGKGGIPNLGTWDAMPRKDKEALVGAINEAAASGELDEPGVQQALSQKFGLDAPSLESAMSAIQGFPLDKTGEAAFGGSATKGEQAAYYEDAGLTDTLDLIPLSEGDADQATIEQGRRDAGTMMQVPGTVEEWAKVNGLELSAFNLLGLSGNIKMSEARKKYKNMTDDWYDAWKSGGIGELRSAVADDGYDPLTLDELVSSDFADRLRSSKEWVEDNNILDTSNPVVKSMDGKPTRGFPTSHPYVDNGDGTQSNAKLATYEVDGKHLVVPTLIDGVQYTPDKAWHIARAQGLENYPSFATKDEAEVWSMRNHGNIGADGEFLSDDSWRDIPMRYYTDPSMGIRARKTMGEVTDREVADISEQMRAVRMGPGVRDLLGSPEFSTFVANDLSKRMTGKSKTFGGSQPSAAKLLDNFARTQGMTILPKSNSYQDNGEKFSLRKIGRSKEGAMRDKAGAAISLAAASEANNAAFTASQTKPLDDHLKAVMAEGDALAAKEMSDQERERAMKAIEKVEAAKLDKYLDSVVEGGQAKPLGEEARRKLEERQKVRLEGPKRKAPTQAQAEEEEAERKRLGAKGVQGSGRGRGQTPY
jgi:hypothetical protein